MIGYLFAGQGAQYVGMGKDLYESFPESKAIFDQADKVLGFSLSRLCFNGPQEELTQTKNCQPAILTMSIAAWEAFKTRTEYRVQSTEYAAGLSLGEYSALVATEAISFTDAVYLVRQRGQFMEEAALKKPGRMLSIIGLDLDKVKQICVKANTEVANINSAEQVVISGGLREIEEAARLAKDQGAKRAVVLEVSGAFHSTFMKEASDRLASALEKIKINKPRIALVCNFTAKVAQSPQEIKDNLIKQVSSSVLWEDSMRLMLSAGISNFIEFGPGKVLKGLLRRIDASANVLNIEKKEDILTFPVEKGGKNAS